MSTKSVFLKNLYNFKICELQLEFCSQHELKLQSAGSLKPTPLKVTEIEKCYKKSHTVQCDSQIGFHQIAAEETPVTASDAWQNQELEEKSISDCLERNGKGKQEWSI